MKHRLIIAGGRDFNNYALLKASIKYPERIKEIVSGTARGADQLGERFAKEFNIPIVRFPADWNKYGRAAGPIRNKEMGDYATVLLAFWDTKSPGTRSMIQYMKSLNKPVKVIEY